MSAKLYAGIGSRETPSSVLATMTRYARCLALDGWTLRSGGANGADTAFERGASNEQSEIYLPWRGYNGNRSPLHAPSPQAYQLAARYHPAWKYCSEPARKLHARNMHIISGEALDNPVEFVLCWTPKAKDVGGTGQALRYARSLGIAIYNLADPTVAEFVASWPCMQENP